MLYATFATLGLLADAALASAMVILLNNLCWCPKALNPKVLQSKLSINRQHFLSRPQIYKFLFVIIKIPISDLFAILYEIYLP